MQIQYKLRDYERLKTERLSITYGGSPRMDGMPRGTNIGKPTESTAIKLAYIDEQLAAIDQSALEMRGRFSKKVYDEFDPIKAYWSYDYYNYMHLRKGDEDEGPSRRTWNYYKSVFSSLIAQKLNIV